MSVLIDIEKKLGDFKLKVNLEAGNEVLALLGASGSGKTMTLKCIAGIEKPDRGRIVVDDKVLFDSEQRINLSPQERFVGLLFQNYALFPNMTVKKNIEQGLKRKTSRKTGSSSNRYQVDEVIERFGLTEVADHFPHQLSGGQQQRTALARLLLSGPGILLLDEPFSALDSHLRFRMEQEVRDVIKDFGKTVIMVSHNRDEVFRMCDQIAIMDRGKVDVYGDKASVFAHPGTRNAAVLTGCKNISPVKKIDERHVLALNWNIVLETQEDVKNSSFVGIRMHSIKQECDEETNTFSCKVAEEVENPFTYTVMLENENSAEFLGWEIDKDKWQEIRGDEMRIHIPPESILLLNR